MAAFFFLFVFFERPGGETKTLEYKNTIAGFRLVEVLEIKSPAIICINAKCSFGLLRYSATFPATASREYE